MRIHFKQNLFIKVISIPLTSRIFSILLILIGMALMSSIGVSAAVSAPAPTVVPDKTAVSKTGNSIRALAYTIKVIPVSTGIEWAVTLKLEGNANGLTEFEMPSSWAGREDLGQGIKDFKVMGGTISSDVEMKNAAVGKSAQDDMKGLTSDSASVIKPLPVSTHLVTHAPGAALTIEYRLARIGSAYPASQRDAYSPVLEANYFHVIGTGAWITPKLAREAPIKITLRWELPVEWAIANSFGAGERTQLVNTTLSSFRQGLYLGGDFRIAKVLVRNYPVYIALRSEWGFFDENFSDLAKRIVEMERAFWPDYRYPFFLVSAIPTGGAEFSSVGGTSLENAFALFLSPRTQIKDLRFLLTHELLHQWNTRQFGNLQEPEQLLYWWSEGITDFYTNRLLLRNGLFTPQEFLKTYNEALRNYTQSKVRNAPNSRIETDFWKNAEVGRLPYLRGMLFATKLDYAIRDASKGQYSLDDVMRDLLKSAQRNEKAGVKIITPKRFDADLLMSHIERRLGRSYSDEFDRYIEQGETIELASYDLGPCFERRDMPFRPYEAGFDSGASTAAKKVIGVVTESAAYKAGLRDGMPLVGWSIYGGDATKEIELSAMVNDKRVVIKYLPVAFAEIIVPQFMLKKELDAAALMQCGRSGKFLKH